MNYLLSSQIIYSLSFYLKHILKQKQQTVRRYQMQQNQFFITFGKENWNTVQADKDNGNVKIKTPLKTSMKKSQYESISKTARTVPSTQTKTIQKRVHFSKQNNYFHDNLNQQPKRNYSLNNPKQTPKRNTYQATSSKNGIIKEPLGFSNKGKLNFNDSPHVSFSLNGVKKQSETKIITKQYQRYTSNAEKTPKFFNDPLDKYELIKTARNYENNRPYQQKIFQYKEDMNRLDSLIERINQRISSSHMKFSH